jgi:hypothetical protein
VTLVATLVLSAGLSWAFFPGVSAELRQATEARLRSLAAAGSRRPAGAERFGLLLQAAFAPADASPAGPVEHNRAAILALGIAVGDPRLARFAGLEPTSDAVRAATTLRSGTSLRGRADWARHYCVSAALAVVETPFLSEAGGLIKEELDAWTQGSGFSFGDLAADRAGVRFARAATASAAAARAMQARLQDGFAVDDFFPTVSDLPENLSVEQFRSDYGGVGSRRYRQAVAEIEARLDRCAGLAPP